VAPSSRPDRVTAAVLSSTGTRDRSCAGRTPQVPCSPGKRNYPAYTGPKLLTTPLDRGAIISQAVETPCKADAHPARRAHTPQPLRREQGGSGNRRDVRMLAVNADTIPRV
jgi:hypothetical protein